jgi:dihydroorotate dehydrogenase (fumarate)
MVIDVENRTMAANNDKGFVWMSGPVIKPLALATVYTIKQAEPSLTVIGVGGISTASDVIEFLLAGASAVQMLSAAMLRGKELYAKILADLPATLEKYGFKSVQEVIDTNLKHETVFGMAEPPSVDLAKCSKCGTCARICPYFAIEMDNGPKFNSENALDADFVCLNVLQKL